MIEEPALRGYVLEEILASLLKKSGYSLLTDRAQDEVSLTGGGNGLRVRGRGADHQVDVLGDLDIRVGLMYPLRLFLEAKCRSATTGIADVRNAVGVIDDVNQGYSWRDAQNWPDPFHRFHYRYALCSTSGFTDDAVHYAVTHQITLVDLGVPSLTALRELVGRIARTLRASALAQGLEQFPVGQMRAAMRDALGTAPPVAPDSPAVGSDTGEDGLDQAGLDSVCADAAEEVDTRLFMAWTNSPFIFFVQPEDADSADQVMSSADDGGLSARLEFVGRSEQEGGWLLEPVDPPSPKAPSGGVTGSAPRNSALRLTLPAQLEPLVLGTDPRKARGRLEFDVQISPSRKTSIKFDPVALPDQNGSPKAAAYQELRRRAPRFTAAEPREPGGQDDSEPTPWTPEAVRELMRRLRAERGGVQAAVIDLAAARGGTVSRQEVYATGGYGEKRTLRGFTRPARRISVDLVDEGILAADSLWPLWALYESGVRASGFAVPDEFRDLIDR